MTGARQRSWGVVFPVDGHVYHESVAADNSTQTASLSLGIRWKFLDLLHGANESVLTLTAIAVAVAWVPPAVLFVPFDTVAQAALKLLFREVGLESRSQCWHWKHHRHGREAGNFGRRTHRLVPVRKLRNFGRCVVVQLMTHTRGLR